jgi:hypothetical protein
LADLYEPYDSLVTIVILGKRFEVPANNLLLRQMQFVAADIGYGQYCWNGECRNCEVTYCLAAQGAEASALACRVKGQAGMRITKLARDVKYNMSEALAAAPKDDEG